MGPKLAKEICVPAGNNLKNYLLNQYDNNFTLKLKSIKSIKLSPVKPITHIVNQILTTGIFPDILKIAKLYHY